eukprot:GFKZ01005809.1.p1 GENE.GFKZ01005809.1~~GFKZ01005809.1.p1  ORF type:complete len:1489 (+),score=232.64 GFKZ01005809.1:100-4566(+)
MSSLNRPMPSPAPHSPPSPTLPLSHPHPDSQPLLSIVNSIFDDRPPSPSSMLTTTLSPSPSCTPPPDYLFDLPTPLQSALDAIPAIYHPIVSHLRHPQLPLLSAIAEYSRPHLASALAYWLNSQRAQGNARAVLIVTRSDATARVWMELLEQHLDEILVTRLSSAKKNFTLVQRLLSGMVYPGVFVAAERTMKVEVIAAMRKAMEENPHGIKWELCVSDTIKEETVHVEWGPMRMVADGEGNRGLILVCEGENKNGVLQKGVFENFVKKELGGSGKVWWRRSEVEKNGTWKDNDGAGGKQEKAPSRKQREYLSISEEHDAYEDVGEAGMKLEEEDVQLIPIRGRGHITAARKTPGRENESNAPRDQHVGLERGDINSEDEARGIITSRGADSFNGLVRRHTRLNPNEDRENEWLTEGHSPSELMKTANGMQDGQPDNENTRPIGREATNRPYRGIERHGSGKLRGTTVNAGRRMPGGSKDEQKGRRPKVFLDNCILDSSRALSTGRSRGLGAGEILPLRGAIVVTDRREAGRDKANYVGECTKQERDNQDCLIVEQPAIISKLPVARKRRIQYSKLEEDNPDTDWGSSSIQNAGRRQIHSHRKEQNESKNPDKGCVTRGLEGERVGRHWNDATDGVVPTNLPTRSTLVSEGEGSRRHNSRRGIDNDKRQKYVEGTWRNKGVEGENFDNWPFIDEQLSASLNVGTKRREEPKRARRGRRRSSEKKVNHDRQMEMFTYAKPTAEEATNRRNSVDSDSFDGCLLFEEPSSTGLTAGARNEDAPRTRRGRVRRKILDDSDLDDSSLGSPRFETSTGPADGLRDAELGTCYDIADPNEPIAAVTPADAEHGTAPKRGYRSTRKIFDDLLETHEPPLNDSSTQSNHKEAPEQVKRPKVFDDPIVANEKSGTRLGGATNRNGSLSRARREGRQSTGNSNDLSEAWCLSHDSRVNFTFDDMRDKDGTSKISDDLVDTDDYYPQKVSPTKVPSVKKPTKNARGGRTNVFESSTGDSFGHTDILEMMQRERERISRMTKQREREERRRKRENGLGAEFGGSHAQTRSRAKTFISDELLKNVLEEDENHSSRAEMMENDVAQSRREMAKSRRTRENRRGGGDVEIGLRSGGYRVCDLRIDPDESDVDWYTPNSGSGIEWDAQGEESGWSDEAHFVTPLSSPKRIQGEGQARRLSLGQMNGAGSRVGGRKREYEESRWGTLFVGGQVRLPGGGPVTGWVGELNYLPGERGKKEMRRMSWGGEGQMKPSDSREKRRRSMPGRSSSKGVDAIEIERVRRERQRRNLRGEELLGIRRGMVGFGDVSVAQMGGRGKVVEGGVRRSDVVVCLDGTYSGGRNEVDGRRSVGESNTRRDRRGSGGRTAVDGSKRKSGERGVRQGSWRDNGGRVRKVRTGGAAQRKSLEDEDKGTSNEMESRRGRRVESKAERAEALKWFMELANNDKETDGGRLADRVSPLGKVKGRRARRGGRNREAQDKDVIELD